MKKILSITSVIAASFGAGVFAKEQYKKFLNKRNPTREIMEDYEVLIFIGYTLILIALIALAYV